MVRHEDELTGPGAPPLDWRVTTAEVDRTPSPKGLGLDREATEDERGRLAEALALEACRGLTAQFTIKALPLGRYAIKGRLTADIVQACVVTLEPVPARIDEPFTGEFAPADALESEAGGEVFIDPEAHDEPFAIIDDRLNVGQVVYESLALALDPFPRAPDAENVALSYGPEGRAEEVGGQASAQASPFAALAALKKPKGG